MISKLQDFRLTLLGKELLPFDSVKDLSLVCNSKLSFNGNWQFLSILWLSVILIFVSSLCWIYWIRRRNFLSRFPWILLKIQFPFPPRALCVIFCWTSDPKQNYSIGFPSKWSKFICWNFTLSTGNNSLNVAFKGFWWIQIGKHVKSCQTRSNLFS